jgi:hypothetical protein
MNDQSNFDQEHDPEKWEPVFRKEIMLKQRDD